jgi:hypothetical protein
MEQEGHDAATVSTVALADGDHDASTISPCRWRDLSPEESRGVEKSGDVRGRRANGTGTATRPPPPTEKTTANRITFFDCVFFQLVSGRDQSLP